VENELRRAHCGERQSAQTGSAAVLSPPTQEEPCAWLLTAFPAVCLDRELDHASGPLRVSSGSWPDAKRRIHRFLMYAVSACDSTLKMETLGARSSGAEGASPTQEAQPAAHARILCDSLFTGRRREYDSESGSAVFASSKGVTAPIHLGLYGMHFNVQLGVSDACCIDCSGYCGLYITPSPTVSVVGQSIQLYAQSYYIDGTLHDFTGSSTWSSNNTGISTVQTSGQANPGLLSGVGLGSCTITASRSLTAQGVHLVGCGGCPGLQVMVAYAQQTVATASITVNPGPPPTPRSNQKSAGDGLAFPSTQSCSQYLGLEGCQYGWFWQSEIFARVPDDASKWTGSQIATGNFSGYEKDGTPFNHAINRNPDPITTQQTSGQKVIFWLDPPGILNTDPNFDRGIYSLSLKSKVCESATCACVNWHIKVVITTGQVLDTKNSEAGVDSYSCN